MNLQFNKFYSPDEGTGTGSSEPADDNLDTLELLNVEDEPEKEESIELGDLD